MNYCRARYTNQRFRERRSKKGIARKEEKIMKKAHRIIAAATFVIATSLSLSGCIGNYYGYTQQEWNNLSQEQQKKSDNQIQ